VNRRLRAILLILPIAAVCAASVWAGLWYRARSEGPAALMRRIPATGAMLVYVDFDALRRAGILDLLSGPKIAEESEYREFTRQIDFDYRKDLDSVLLAVAPTGKYLLVHGRFDWKRLRAYVDSQNGRCYDSLCRMQGSTPERRISFFPVQSDLMALAVSNDDSAALRMSSAAGEPPAEVPDAPLWVSVPPSVLQSEESLPAETRAFAQSLEGARSVVLSFAPERERLTARLEVRCRNAQDAGEVAAQLTRLTGLVRQTFEKAHRTPNPADLTGVLTAGTFRTEDSRVFGQWPIEQPFVRNLLGSGN